MAWTHNHKSLPPPRSFHQPFNRLILSANHFQAVGKRTSDPLFYSWCLPCLCQTVNQLYNNQKMAKLVLFSTAWPFCTDFFRPRGRCSSSRGWSCCRQCRRTSMWTKWRGDCLKTRTVSSLSTSFTFGRWCINSHTERGILSVARFCYVFPCELREPAWAVGSYSISQSAGGTSQIIIFKTLRQIGRPALYIIYDSLVN